MKKTLSLLALVVSLPFFFSGCGEEDEDFTTFFVRTLLTYNNDSGTREINHMFIEGVSVGVFVEIPNDQNDLITFRLKSKNVPIDFSFTMEEAKRMCVKCIPIESESTYTGTIQYAAFKEGALNHLEIIEQGDGYGLEINGSTAGVTIVGDGPEGSEFAGRWVRLPGPSGDRTDLAIGNIPGQPDNRVYMCEKRGSSVAGLYKGTINGSTIVWDAAHNLPVFSVSKSGDELVLDCDVCQPTNYASGSWSGECPL